ncbi:hypothetical protein Syun_030706 [Stephania yunnanensis]|uniref:Uncharacterized protein n=1 Tax=Stephania yunnanensis TaxID=152371 RepID=A0AAP0DTU9_9MAGN
MLSTMVPEHHKDMEHMEAYDMAMMLKEMFQQQARQERQEKGLKEKAKGRDKVAKAVVTITKLVAKVKPKDTSISQS